MTKQEQFIQLYRPVARDVETFALHLTRHRERAKDLVAETIEAVYTGLERLRSHQAFLSYCFTIMRRIHNAHRVHLARMEYVEPQTADQLFADAAVTPEDAAERALLYQALGKLPPPQAEALILHYIHGLTGKEIAEIQETTAVNVKVRIHRARKQLETLLTDPVREQELAKTVRHATELKTSLT